MTSTRWLFGDQLGPHFLDPVGRGEPAPPVLLIESKAVFRRRRFHRQKAHLVLSAMRHRAAELGQQCHYVKADTYAAALTAQLHRRERRPPGTEVATTAFSVVHPTSRAALEFVQSRTDVDVLPARGYVASMADFGRWAAGRRRLVLEDFYRDSRRRLDILMDGSQPAGGRWNFDADNREPPPKGASALAIAAPWWPVEDEIDEEVRRDLDEWERAGEVSFVGQDGPRRFAATRAEATAALDRFVDHRLSPFGPHEDAMMAGDDWMAHSLLSAPMNLGLLDPIEVVAAAEAAYRAGRAPLASVEGFVRQVMGWRDYVWHLYWYQPDSYRRGNALGATAPLPKWFVELDADAVEARCLSETLRLVRDHGWVHHIPRLMVLGNYAMQRGWAPAEVLDWFHRSFVDGYDWVMVPNVIGMSQYADNGIMATKPYAGGGAYINRMSDYCGGCRYDPKQRLGEQACPFTAGYWAFLDRNTERLRGNQRIARSLAGAARLKDLPAVVEQELIRGSDAP